MKSFILLVGVLYSSVTFAGDANNGKQLFTSRGCIGCHAIGTEGTSTTGPNLAGVMQRRKLEWVTKWLKNPNAMKTDPIILKLKVKYPSDMPDMGLTDSDVSDLIAYLTSVKAPAGK